MDVPRLLVMLTAAVAMPLAATASSTPATKAIDAVADRLIAIAEASAPDAVFANFADGQHYVAFKSQATYETALAAFVSAGPSDGTGSYVARVFHDATGNRYVTFGPCTQKVGTPNSATRNETALYEPGGRLIRLLTGRQTCSSTGCDATSYHAYWDANGKKLLGWGDGGTLRFAPGTATEPAVSRPTPASAEMYLPSYKTLGELPFKL